MVYRGTPSSGDHEDVGEAMQAMLRLIRQRLTEAGGTGTRRWSSGSRT